MWRQMAETYWLGYVVLTKYINRLSACIGKTSQIQCVNHVFHAATGILTLWKGLNGRICVVYCYWSNSVYFCCVMRICGRVHCPSSISITVKYSDVLHFFVVNHSVNGILLSCVGVAIPVLTCLNLFWYFMQLLEWNNVFKTVTSVSANELMTSYYQLHWLWNFINLSEIYL